jgi:hypothetical protein
MLRRGSVGAAGPTAETSETAAKAEVALKSTRWGLVAAGIGLLVALVAAASLGLPA